MAACSIRSTRCRGEEIVSMADQQRHAKELTPRLVRNGYLERSGTTQSAAYIVDCEAPKDKRL
jgi:hypothetical protein